MNICEWMSHKDKEPQLWAMVSAVKADARSCRPNGNKIFAGPSICCRRNYSPEWVAAAGSGLMAGEAWHWSRWWRYDDATANFFHGGQFSANQTQGSAGRPFSSNAPCTVLFWCLSIEDSMQEHQLQCKMPTMATWTPFPVPILSFLSQIGNYTDLTHSHRTIVMIPEIMYLQLSENSRVGEILVMRIIITVLLLCPRLPLNYCTCSPTYHIRIAFWWKHEKPL